VLSELASALRSIKTALSGEPWAPHATIALTGQGLDLAVEKGDGRLVVNRVALTPTGTWSKDHYWSGTFHLVLAMPPKNGVAQPDAELDVSIAGRLEPIEILRGLARHINERTIYGARVSDCVLDLLGPSVEKTPNAEGVDRLFNDLFVRPAF
jgi:hypothetical protein